MEIIKEVEPDMETINVNRRPLSTKNKRKVAFEINGEVEEFAENVLASFNLLLTDPDFLTVWLGQEKTDFYAENKKALGRLFEVTRRAFSFKRNSISNNFKELGETLQTVEERELNEELSSVLQEDIEGIRFEKGFEEEKPEDCLVKLLLSNLNGLEKVMRDNYFSEGTVAVSEESIKMVVIKRRGSIRSFRDSHIDKTRQAFI